MAITYSDSQIIYLKELYYECQASWEDIARKWNKKFNGDKSASALRAAHDRWGYMYEIENEDRLISNLRDFRRAKRRTARTTKENNILLDELDKREEIISAVREVISTLKTKPANVKVRASDDSKNSMTMELILSDLHYGKLTPQFNAKVARARASQLTRIFLREYKDHKKLFSIDKIIIALIGDIIESYTMHGLESASSCELSNSEQIVLAIKSIYEDIIVPIASLGVPVDVPCVTGNHDRTERDKTLVNVGRSNVTWIIYNALADLCKVSGYEHVNFELSSQPYLLYNIYKNSVLYEHGDHIKNTNKGTIETHIANRQKQLGKVIDFIRLGHWHEVTMYEQGRIIINGCLAGQDSYADVKGYNTHAFQVINYYIETDDRPNCFYKSFPVYLK